MALTALRIAKLTTPGRFADGGGLYVQVSKPGTRAWPFRFTLQGRARQMGLGSVDDVTLAAARELAAAARREVRAGRDPIEARKAARAQQVVDIASAMTFRQAALAAIAAREAGWGNDEHRHQWKRSLELYAFPTIGNLPTAAVDTGLVLKCVEPIWNGKRVTAERVRGRIEAVLDWAGARGYRTGDNPARWRGHLEHLLAGQAVAVVHMKALPYDALPAFMRDLRARQGTTSRALEFTILTANRTGEAINARWAEIDGTIWTVPRERMKGTIDKRKEHRVPLSSAAVALLNELPRVNEFVFPGRGNGPLHDKAMGELLRAMGAPATVHSFRSSFKDWASETTAYPNEISEMALAHRIPHKVEAAYRRGDLFEKRRRLMEDWAAFCPVMPADNRNNVVVPIRGAN
jgi:integrase